MNTIRFSYAGEEYTAGIERNARLLHINYSGEHYQLELVSETPGVLVYRLGDRLVTVHWADEPTKRWLSVDGCTYLIEKPISQSKRKSQETGSDGQLRAPMPAQIRQILVSVGEQVNKGQTLFLLEAMKMEIRVQAPAAGQIEQIFVQPGETTERDQLLARLTAE